MRALAILAAALLAVASSPRPATGGESPVPIVQLALADHLVTIASSAEGPRFTVRDRDFALLASAVTLEELSAREPALGRLLESALARESGLS